MLEEQESDWIVPDCAKHASGRRRQSTRFLGGRPAPAAAAGAAACGGCGELLKLRQFNSVAPHRQLLVSISRNVMDHRGRSRGRSRSRSLLARRLTVER